MEEEYGLRKVVIELKPEVISKFGMDSIFEKAKYIEPKQFVKLDYERGLKVVVADIMMKPGHDLKKLEFPKGATILYVLGEKGSKYTCLLKSDVQVSLKGLLGVGWQAIKKVPPFSEALEHLKQRVEFVPVPPFLISEEKTVFSFIGDKKSTEAILNIFRFFNVVKAVRFLEPSYGEFDLLACLTGREREVMMTARRLGYYQYPRAASTKEIAQELGITKTTLIEHLRKAENKLVTSVIA